MPGAGAQDPARLLARDVDYSGDDFRRIAGMLRDAAGIRMSEANEALVFSRLSKRVRALGLSRFSDYIDVISSGGGRAEREAMIAALTTNTTRFFREDYHFEILRREVMPGLMEIAAAGGRVRLWSAACSSGEEAYTLAAVVLRHFPEVAGCDFKILATDINRSVLAKAEAARYARSNRDVVGAEYAHFMFEDVPGSDDEVVIRPEIRALVTFRYMNFMEPWPVRGPFGAILCRNVMIYMDEATQARIWAGLASVLMKGGYLFIGHSERIGPELKDRLELVGKTTFRHV